MQRLWPQDAGPVLPRCGRHTPHPDIALEKARTHRTHTPCDDDADPKAAAYLAADAARCAAIGVFNAIADSGPDQGSNGTPR